MIRRLVRLACVTVTGTAVAGVFATPAHAETSGVRDSVGDVIAYDREEEIAVPVEGGDGYGLADITKATMTYGAERIILKIQVRDLAAWEDRLWTARAYLRSSDDKKYRVARTRNEEGDVVGMVWREYGPSYSGTPQPCDVTFRRSPARNEFSWVFDHECLGSPEWFRFGALTLVDTVPGSPPVALMDDARRGTEYRSEGPHFNARIRGPRLHAGPPVETPTP